MTAATKILIETPGLSIGAHGPARRLPTDAIFPLHETFLPVTGLTRKGALMFSRKFPIGKVAAGFAIGAISGAVIALLFAPQSGKKLQKRIVDATEGLMDKV